MAMLQSLDSLWNVLDRAQSATNAMVAPRIISRFSAIFTGWMGVIDSLQTLHVRISMHGTIGTCRSTRRTNFAALQISTQEPRFLKVLKTLLSSSQHRAPKTLCYPTSLHRNHLVLVPSENHVLYQILSLNFLLQPHRKFFCC